MLNPSIIKQHTHFKGTFFAGPFLCVVLFKNFKQQRFNERNFYGNDHNGNVPISEQKAPGRILYWLVGLAVIVILSIAFSVMDQRNSQVSSGIPVNTSPHSDTNLNGTLPSDPSVHPDKRSTTNNPDGTIGTPTDSNKTHDIQYE